MLLWSPLIPIEHQELVYKALTHFIHVEQKPNATIEPSKKLHLKWSYAFSKSSKSMTINWLVSLAHSIVSKARKTLLMMLRPLMKPVWYGRMSRSSSGCTFLAKDFANPL